MTGGVVQNYEHCGVLTYLRQREELVLLHIQLSQLLQCSDIIRQAICRYM